MFSDILTPLLGMGIDLDFTPGPVVGNPIRSEQDINALSIPDPDTSTGYVGKLLRNLRQEVNGRVPIIGFAGAPFTLACYLVEGGNSKLFSQVTRLFLNHPRQARKLTRKLTTMTINYLNYQIENGARVIQLFDTWAGILSLDDYREFVFPYIVEIFDSLHQKGEVPTIYYINGGNHLLSIMAETGADVISLDWRSDIGETKQLIGDRVALQGNLDPNTLFCDPDVIENRVRRVLEKYGSDSGHIFNLGHGIDKNVDPERLRIMVSAVKKFSVRQ
jgi:uroporphyrinogen decarboxylase